MVLTRPPLIHLGHLVLLKKLRTFQDLGHIVYFIVGDFTASIGDPSGRVQERPVLSRDEILKNARTYTDQAFKILDPEKTEVIFNSSWFNLMKLEDTLLLFKSYTVSRLLERDDFEKRIKDNKPITMLEFIYPILQGYDSVKLESDIEIGGNDQKFNLIIGRRIQSYFQQKSQVVITLPLLVGTDGKKKMSKSVGNYIGIQESPSDIFGKTMAVSDEVMLHYYEMLTNYNLEEIKSMHPKEAKQKLAFTFVEMFYGTEKAREEQDKFNSIFSEQNIKKESLSVYSIERAQKVIDLIHSAGIIKSKNEIRRLIKQGAIEFQGKKIKDDGYLIDENGILRIGKKKFLNIELSQK